MQALPLVTSTKNNHSSLVLDSTNSTHLLSRQCLWCASISVCEGDHLATPPPEPAKGRRNQEAAGGGGDQEEQLPCLTGRLKNVVTC